MSMVYVIPLKVVITQALLLLLAIAIEGAVLQQQFKWTPRKSIEYSASINLLSALLGWLVFFFLTESLPLPREFQLQLFNVLFFDQWASEIFAWLISGGFVVFFSTVLVEVMGFYLLKRVLSEQKPIEEETAQNVRSVSLTVMRFQDSSSRSSSSKGADPVSAILMGNAFSYGVAVLLLLALRLANQFGGEGSLG